MDFVKFIEHVHRTTPMATSVQNKLLKKKKLQNSQKNSSHGVLQSRKQILAQSPFTTSERKLDYYHQNVNIKLPHELPNYLRLRILGN